MKYLLLLLALAACTTPAPTQPATASATQTDVPTDTSTPVPTWTARPTSTDTATPTATATRQPTVTPSRTLAATATSDALDFGYPVTITITPPAKVSQTFACIYKYFDVTWTPGNLHIIRRNKGGYFDCVGNPVAQQQNARGK